MTVEIEHVNTEILDVLVSEGKEIHPKPSTIRMIQVMVTYFKCYFCFYFRLNMMGGNVDRKVFEWHLNPNRILSCLTLIRF